MTHRSLRRTAELAATALLVLLLAAAYTPRAHALTTFTDSQFSVGQGPSAVAVGDLNGDGRQDIVAANTEDDTASVLLGDGDGAFIGLGATAVGDEPRSVAIGDIDGDGLLDLVTGNAAHDTVSVLLGHGNGTFAAHADHPCGQGPRGVSVADVNADGKLDVVTANTYGDSVSVLLGDGVGSFATPISYAVGASPRAVTVGDLNADGAVDLLSANFDDDSVSVLLGDSDGDFAAKADYPTSADPYAGAGPTCIVLADFDGDGNLDVLTGDEGGRCVSLIKGDGLGALGPGVSWPAKGVTGLGVADFSGDGRPDFVSVDSPWSVVGVRISAGDGSFYSRVDSGDYPGGITISVGLAVGDFNCDSRPDVVVANSFTDDVSVFLGNPPGLFALRADCGLGGNLLAIADLNDDGTPDAIGASYGGEPERVVRVALGAGNGLALPTASYGVGFAAACLTTGDFNSDGHVDVVVGDWNHLIYLAGNGDGTLAAAAAIGNAQGAFAAKAGDFNNDGLLDLATALPYSGQNDVKIWLGHGDGAFDAPISNAAGSVEILAVGDFNHDDHPDLATGISGGSPSVLLGRGDGTFLPKVTYSGYGAPLVVADLNGDGNEDIALSGPSLLLGSGDGTFGARIIHHTLGSDPVGTLAAGDFNMDGKVDLVCGSDRYGVANVFLNRGDATFLEHPEKIVEDYTPSRAIATADFDGDGKIDLASNEEGSGLRVLLSSGYATPAASFAINGGAAMTNSLTVDIASEAVGAAAMRAIGVPGVWAPWQPYAIHTSAVLAPGDGERDVYIDYRDAAGNAIRLWDSIIVDMTPPTCHLTCLSGWQKDSIEIDIHAHDSGSGLRSGLAMVEYRRDDSGWCQVPKESSFEFHVTGDGTHTVDYRATDALGNRSAIQTHRVYVDAAPPVTTATGADNAWHNRDVTVAFKASDTGVGTSYTQYSFDGGVTWNLGASATVCSMPTNPADHTQAGGDGIHAISYRSVDSFGHVEATKTCSVKINTTDVTPPAVGATGADAAWHRRPVTVQFMATDAETGVSGTAYSTDGGTTWTLGSQIVVSSEGETTLLYRATDDVGNISPTLSCVVRIDTHRPTTLASHRSSATRGGKATLRYEVRDALPGSGTATVTIRLFNSHRKLVKTLKRTMVTSNISHRVRFRCSLPSGRYVFRVYATDSAGNAQTKAAASVLIVR